MRHQYAILVKAFLLPHFLQFNGGFSKTILLCAKLVTVSCHNTLFLTSIVYGSYKEEFSTMSVVYMQVLLLKTLFSLKNYIISAWSLVTHMGRISCNN